MSQARAEPVGPKGSSPQGADVGMACLRGLRCGLSWWSQPWGMAERGRSVHLAMGGVRAREGGGGSRGWAGVWACCFHSLLPLFSVLTLLPLPYPALYPWTRPLGFPVREGVTLGRGVREAQEATGHFPLRVKAGLGRWIHRPGSPRRTDSGPGVAIGVAGA